jgi:hypothetical protein
VDGRCKLSSACCHSVSPSPAAPSSASASPSSVSSSSAPVVAEQSALLHARLPPHSATYGDAHGGPHGVALLRLPEAKSIA